ncbi:MAG: macro domain-containing protein [Archangium sp.]|nr:macro domain-containing protein [Archangium sp.]
MSLCVEFVQGSLTDGRELVLVNASNTNAELGSGVSGAIRRACGPRFQAQVLEALQSRFAGPMPPGEVLLTLAGAHPTAKWVAHVAVMDYRKGMGPHSFPTLDTVRKGCARLWEVLETLPGPEPLSVAMVAVGAGTGDLAVGESARVAVETLKAHEQRTKSSRIARVRFYGFLAHELVPMAKALAQEYPDVLQRLPAEVRHGLKSASASSGRWPSAR